MIEHDSKAIRHQISEIWSVLYKELNDFLKSYDHHFSPLSDHNIIKQKLEFLLFTLIIVAKIS